MEIAGTEIPLNTVIAASVLAVVGLALIFSPRLSMPADGDTNAGQQQNLSHLLNGSEPSLGNSSAPVAIVYWGDYQCPNCGRFERTTFEDLRGQYIETGEVLFVKKDFPNVAGRKSELAAQVGECVWRMEDPDTFWDWHEGMYNESVYREIDAIGSIGTSSADVRTTIIDIAERLIGINTADLSACIEENRTSITREIAEDQDEANELGLYSTPGFIIYDRQTGQRRTLWGARDISAFEQRIEAVQDG